MSIFHDYSFTRPFTPAGKPARYISVLLRLNATGAMSKRDLLKEVWNVSDPYNQNLWRGHMSDLFASMRRKRLIEYRSDDQKWRITDNGRMLLKNTKIDWGMKFAEHYWKQFN